LEERTSPEEPFHVPPTGRAIGSGSRLRGGIGFGFGVGFGGAALADGRGLASEAVFTGLAIMGFGIGTEGIAAGEGRRAGALGSGLARGSSSESSPSSSSSGLTSVIERAGFSCFEGAAERSLDVAAWVGSGT
jgi:hypothetical protein